MNKKSATVIKPSPRLLVCCLPSLSSQLISRAKATAGEAAGRGRVAGALANPAAAAAAAAVAAAAGPNALAPSAVDEAETVLECLSSLLPALEEASRMAAKVMKDRALSTYFCVYR